MHNGAVDPLDCGWYKRFKDTAHESGRHRATGESAIDFNQYKQRYREEINHSFAFTGRSVDFFARLKARHLLDCVTRMVGEARSLRVLDVGCGVGVIHPFIAGEVQLLHGLDSSDALIAEARTANPRVVYTCSDATRMPYGEGAFDVAFTICVVHHVARDNRAAMFREMCRVVRTGGVVVIFEHNPINPLTRLAVWRCSLDTDAELLMMRETRSLLDHAGLRVAGSRYIVWAPWDNRVTRCAEDALRRIPLGGQYYVAAVRP